MADIKSKYPATNADTAAITCTLASLPTSSSLLVGKEATAIDNTTNLDVDHILSGKITTGTSPTVSTKIEVWAFAFTTSASGTPTWPQSATGSDATLTLNSDNAKFSGWLKLVASMTVDATSNRAYEFGGVSVAMLFGGVMPPKYSLFVTHSTAVNLNATAGNHSLNYERIQAQTV